MFSEYILENNFCYFCNIQDLISILKFKRLLLALFALYVIIDLKNSILYCGKERYILILRTE